FNLSILSNPNPAGQPITGFVWIQVCPTGQCSAKKYEASGPFEADSDYSGQNPLFTWNESFYSGQPAIIPGSRIFSWMHLYNTSIDQQVSNEIVMMLEIPES